MGSSAYPNFCAFGKNLDLQMEKLGAERLVRVGLLDELKEQENSFRDWQVELATARGIDIMPKGSAEFVKIQNKLEKNQSLHWKKHVAKTATELESMISH